MSYIKSSVFSYDDAFEVAVNKKLRKKNFHEKKHTSTNILNLSNTALFKISSKEVKKAALVMSAITLGAFSLGTATPAQAFDFAVSGQVNRGVVAASNGDESDIGFVDNEDWNTRFRFTGSQKMNNGSTLGFTYEIHLSANPSTGWDINSNGNDNGTSLENRLAEVWIKGNYGKLSFGRVDSASDGTSEMNYANTTYMGMGIISPYDLAAGISILGNEGYDTGVKIGDLVNDLNGFDRRGGVLYASPRVNGFGIEGGIYGGHAFDLAPSFETSFGDGGKFGAILEYADSQKLNSLVRPDGTVIEGRRYKEWGGSTSLLLPIGISFAASYKHRDMMGHGTDPDNYYGSVGYNFGKHSVSVDYNETKNLLNSGSALQSIGVGYAYQWVQGVTLYTSYHHYIADDFVAQKGSHTGEKIDGKNVDVLFGGILVQFL